MSRKKAITLDKLAGELGLTKHTVSKALRGLPGMSEETRLAVCEHAAKRGYYTKEQKQNAMLERTAALATVKPRRFLFIVPTHATGSDTHYLLLQGLQERATEAGHFVNMLFVPTTIENDRQFGDWLEQNRVMDADGIFITPNTPLFIEQKLLGLDMPRIMLNFKLPEYKVDSVIWDVQDVTRVAVKYLLSQGHRRIMYIGDVSENRGSKLRWEAFELEMREAGIEIDPRSHLLERSERLELLSEHFLERYRSYKPTALISTGYYDLKWIYYACSTLQLQIPQDCSLMTLSTFPLVANETRPLFMIKECGSRAVDSMLWRLEHPQAPYEQVRLFSPFHEGSTVAPIGDAAVQLT